MECPAPMRDRGAGDCGITATPSSGRTAIRPGVRLCGPGVGVPGSDTEIVSVWCPADLESLFPALTSGRTRNFDVAGV